MTPDVVETSIFATPRCFAVIAPELPTTTTAAASATSKLMIPKRTSPPLVSQHTSTPTNRRRSDDELRRKRWIFLEPVENRSKSVGFARNGPESAQEGHFGSSTQASSRVTARWSSAAERWNGSAYGTCAIAAAGFRPSTAS